MGIRSMASLPRRWRGAAGVGVVTLLAVIGSYVEANPVHAYGGLHLTRHPPLAAYLLVGVPALALLWRESRPAGVFLLAVAGDVGWAALGQIDGAALVPVMVALYWVALTRSRRVALAAGIAGAVVIFLAEGLLGPFGWLGGPNATMWPECSPPARPVASSWRAASGWPPSTLYSRPRWFSPAPSPVP